MGLSRILVLPSNESTSPEIFFPTQNIDLRNEAESDVYQLISLEELEVEMITEVTTTEEDEDDIFPGDLPVMVAYDDTDGDLQLSAQIQVHEIRTEFPDEISSTVNDSPQETSSIADLFSPHRNHVQNICEDGLDDIPVTVSDFDSDESVLSWLSSLNETTFVNETGQNVLDNFPATEMTSSDLCLAKDELRSFLLSRKRQEIDPLRDQESNPKHNHFTKTKRRKLEVRDSEELRRLRRRQESNRIAARKCRQKRTQFAEDLVNESDELRKQNEELTSAIEKLTSELEQLQDIVLNHDLHMSTTGCHETLSTILLDMELVELI